MRKFFYLFLAFYFALPAAYLLADEIHLVNGDKITGEIAESDVDSYVIKTEHIGLVTISKQTVSEIKSSNQTPPPEPKKLEKNYWSGKITSGFGRQSGNTDTKNLNGSLEIKRKIEKVNEFDIQANGLYGAEDRKMNAQKYDAFTRYAWSFGKDKKWYNFYKAEADHDRFANISSRYTPTTGLGYWFLDSGDFKLMAESGIGITYTNYRVDQENTTEIIFTPRIFIEKKIIGAATISEDFQVYQALNDEQRTRFKSETSFKNPITENLVLKVSWINEYNSKPGPAKKLDMRLTTGFEYSF